MVYKIDINHRNKKITFGPRFKGEVGKDIFAAKVALGILSPAPSGSEIESGVDVSFDVSIPLDQQKWFDCSTGLGVDLAKATKFDTTLENALLTYQVNNQFLITSYYFEKYGFQSMLNAAIDEDTIFESELVVQNAASQRLFEAELKTLGEATVALLHGWLPGTRLVDNTSYTHDPETYSREGSTVRDIVTSHLFDSLNDFNYPQNFGKLVESGIAVPQTLIKPTPLNPLSRDFFDQLDARRFALALAGEQVSPEFKYAFIQYYPVVYANSPLYTAAAKVIDYYLENNLFSQTLSQEEVEHQARRALYPDPFSRTDTFIIDGTKLGIFTETDFFLSAESNSLPVYDDETIALLEEKALISALGQNNKPKIWNFLRYDPEFRTTYFSQGNPDLDPQHSGTYPLNITTEMAEQGKLIYGDLFPGQDATSFQLKEFKKNEYWILSTSDVTNELEEENASSVEYWRIIEGQGGTEPLIKFVEFITPGLRPGQSYRALFEINRQKFELITAGDNLEQEQEDPETNNDPVEEQVCLDQGSEQAERTYEEYKTHAIKKRRELVRKIKQIVREKNRSGGRLDLGAVDSLFDGVSPNVETYSDYQVMQKLGQLLPGQELAELIASPLETDWLAKNTLDNNSSTPNPDEDSNRLSITLKELEERVEKATKDLREAASVVQRERINFHKDSQFNGQNEAVHLSLIVEEVESVLDKQKVNYTDETTITFVFENSSFRGPGHLNGKKLASIGPLHDATNWAESEALSRPRTMNYLSKIKEMTFFPKMISFFDDSRGSCKDLGINVEKITAKSYVTKYTSGLKKGVIKEDEEFSFKTWWEEKIEEPIVEFAATSGENLEDSFDADNFPSDAALRALGKECDLEKVWSQAIDKLDPVSLLCDYIKCLNLPAFDIKFPDFRLPPIPKIPILGWYSGFIKFLEEQYKQILTRLACTISKMIIDKLAFPFCEEQLSDFISNDLLSDGFAKQAVIDALIDTGVPNNKAKEAKDFFDSTANILTGKELCYILKGNRPDDATMYSISRLVEANGLSEFLGTSETIVNFFGVIGIYVPEEICDALNSLTTVAPTNCEDTNDLLRSIRNRLQSGDSNLTEEEINNAVAIAEKNKQEEADRLKNLFENGFDGLVPPLFDYGNPDSPMPDFPEHFKREQEKTAESVFAPAKTTYNQGLSKYVPAMYIGTPTDLWPYDERYDQGQVLRIEAALQQIEDYAQVVDPDRPGGVADLSSQWATLHQLYQTEVITKFSQNSVPKDKRSSLELSREDDPAGNPMYLIPHESKIYSDFMPRMGGAISNTVQGALVHKRRIKTGNLTPEEIGAQIESLNIIINRYTQRVSDRGSGRARKRLRAERKPYIEQRDRLQQVLDNLENSPDMSVDYEFFMNYQRAAARFNLQDGEKLEFELIPWNEDSTGIKDNTGIYSMSFEYSNFLKSYIRGAKFINNLEGATGLDDDTKLPSGRSLLTAGAISSYLTSKVNLSGDAASRFQDSTDLIKQRIDSLTNRILEILSSRPPITDNSLFPQLQEMLEIITEKTLEEKDQETVESKDNEFKIKFNAGTIYSPSITMREIAVDDRGKDRFDMIIEGDFYVGLDLAGNDGSEPGIKEFRYCNELPDLYSQPGPLNESSETYFGKREKFRNLALNSISKVSGIDPSQHSLEMKRFIEENLYKSTTESMIESLLDEVSESYLFEAEDVDELDRRVAGKRITRPCISNRFSFAANSVASFDKVIMGDLSLEVAKEMSKPENSPENYDFDSPSAFDLALQNMALKGFIRVCLMDVLLKGGLAYSVWDIEPITGEKFFIDYAISYVRNQLETSSEVKEAWPQVIERVTGITNRFFALETLVKQEMLKLPGYSKQIFHPDENSIDFYNWFVEKKIPQFMVPSSVPADTRHLTGENSQRIYEDEDELRLVKGKQKFIIEHYIELVGKELVTFYLHVDINDNYDTDLDRIIISFDDFLSFKTRRTQHPEFLDGLEKGSIRQGARLVLLDTISASTEEAPDIPIFTKLYEELVTRHDEEELLSLSRQHRSYLIKVKYIDDDDGSGTRDENAFAIPLSDFTRELDFKECYDLKCFSKEEFLDSIPFMIDNLTTQDETVLVLENIFPTRRLMSMVSVFSTSVISGFNNMPTIFTAPKSALATLLKTLGLGRRQRSSLVTISQEEFLKQLTENFPTDESNCIEFPSGLGDMFKRFIEELWDLIKQMPSIIFRGVANQIDPAYKEMRQHYINCDIEQLSWRGVKPYGTSEKKLTNGLYLKGRHDGMRGIRQNVELDGLTGDGKGKYVPLALGLASDITYAIGAIPNFSRFGTRLGISIAKLVTYIYSGNAPLIDPAFYFKIPCADIDVGAWRDKGKYDAGLFGRYGHPLSPFTALALSTYELESDKRARKNGGACKEEEVPECIPVNTGLLELPPPPRTPRQISAYHRLQTPPIDCNTDSLLDLDIQNPDIMGPDDTSETRLLDFEECRLSWEARISVLPEPRQDRLLKLLDDMARIDYMITELLRLGYETTGIDSNVSLEGPLSEYTVMNEEELLQTRDWYENEVSEIKSSYTELELQCATADEYMEYAPISGQPRFTAMPLIAKLAQNRRDQAISNDRRT